MVIIRFCSHPAHQQTTNVNVCFEARRLPNSIRICRHTGRTETDIDAKQEKTIRDFWTTDDADRNLSQPWIGRVVFELRRPDPGKQYEYVEGQLTKLQKTQRPGHITVLDYKKGKKVDVLKWRREWKTEGPARDRERAKRGMPQKLPSSEKVKYDEIMKPLRAKYGIPTAPAMPVIALDLPEECFDSDNEPIAISPHERFKLFNKLWKPHKKRKSQAQKEFIGHAPGTAKEFTGHAPGTEKEIAG